MTINRLSGFDPADNICWQFNNPGDREQRCTCPACESGFGKRALAFFGRCRSGKRWFWSAHTLFDDVDKEANGFTDTEREAIDAGMAAVRSFRDRVPILARISHGCASRRLKEINAEKRRAKPPSNAKDTPVVEYLYSGKRDYDDYDSRSYLVFYRFRITKRTAKRIFYVRGHERIDEHSEPIDDGNFGFIARDTDNDIGFVDRMKLETEGHVYNRGHHWSSEDHHLYASLETLRASFYREDKVKPVDLAALKAAMADAHPDKGGSSAAFIEARAAYVAARRAAR